MARIRTIKPEFFTSEDIVGLSPLARLLYIALWCEADREGRLVWKPKTFKMRYFPGDKCDIDALCNEILDTGLIVQYGECYAYIPTFHSHQHINPRESQTQLPTPDVDAIVTRASRVSDAQVGRERKGKEGNDKEPTVLVQDNLGRSDRVASCPTEELIGMYHKHLPMLPRVEVLNDTRRKHLSARWRSVITDKEIADKSDPKKEALDFFDWYFERVSQSQFLTGKSKHWKADFDFLVNPQKFTKVIEGHYHKDSV